MSEKTRYDIGKLGEDYVAGFLIRHGYKILNRNWRICGGEIDIIAQKNDTIAFVEVKTRKSNSLVSGEQAINYYKRKFITRTAEQYMSRNKYIDFNGRLDVAVVEVNNEKVVHLKYYPNAFSAQK